MKCIELDDNQRIYVSKHRFEEAWFNLSGDYYHVATALTKQQTEKLIVALQEAIERPSYVVRLTTSFDPNERWSAVREDQAEHDPVGFGATEELAIQDLEEKIDQS